MKPETTLRVMIDRHAQNVAAGIYSERDVLAWAYSELSLRFGGNGHMPTQQMLAKLNLMSQVA